MKNAWVNKLINNERWNDATGDDSSEQFLQTQAKRYAIVFEELIRQVSLKSTKTATLLSKLWRHEQQLLDRVFQKYSKQTAQTMQVKGQIQQLSKECIAKVKQSQQRLQDMTKNVQDTQDELIEREVELKRLQRSLAQCVDENERLRAIIVSHIEKDQKVRISPEDEQANRVAGAIDENEAILDRISEVMEDTFTQLDKEGRHKVCSIT